jgi:signal transduction histidine kinase
LLEEHAQGRSLSARANMLDLMLNQVSRMSRVIEDYRRMARLEVERQSLDARDFVASVLALQSLAPPAGVVVKSEVPAAPLECQIDPELLARALENLVRNALEAMPGGGTLTVSLERLQTEVTGGVILSVADTGVGMDARQAARVFDDFYTTKAEGSGLGLSLVRRVAQAHGGHVELSSEPGRGTRVVLSLPNG